MARTTPGPAHRQLLNRRQLVVGAAATAAALASSQRWMSAQGSAVTVSRGSTARAVVALTFDAGADRGYCPLILDTLASTGVRASFGMTGEWAEANGDLVQRAVADGHELFNHTHTHRSFTGATPGTRALTSAERLEELESSERILTNLAGVGGRPVFRPPYGDFDSSVLADLGRAGFTYNLMWSLDVNGWRGLSQDQIVSRVNANHGNGFIYLMHVGGGSQEGPALPRIISGLRDRGYGFVTVSELLGLTPPPPAFAEGDAVRVTAELNLRAEPILGGALIATMPAGTVCTVLAGPRTADGHTWYHLQTQFGTGWASSDRLALASLVDQLVAILVRILREILGDSVDSDAGP